MMSVRRPISKGIKPYQFLNDRFMQKAEVTLCLDYQQRAERELCDISRMPLPSLIPW
jgi:hypothetical protein